MNLKKLSKNQKVALGIGAVILIYLVYRWQSASAAAAGATGTGASTTDTTGTTGTNLGTADQSASDYASLAGQEQSDVAALQDQIQQLAAGSFGASSGLGAGAGGGTTSDGASSIPAQATGSTPVNRAERTIRTHPGGAFFNYYKRVTGQNPPARLQATNFIYQAWQAGISATGLEQLIGPHPSAPGNKRIQHPNPNHTPQHHVDPFAPRRGVPPALVTRGPRTARTSHGRRTSPARRK